MKAVFQRCLSASVTVESQVVSSIGKGILVLAAIGPNDTMKDIEQMADKVLKMKLWPDDEGRQWKQNVRDINGEGNKPDFHGAAGPDKAKELYARFLEQIGQVYQPDRVKNGVFQAMMQVALVNDGPVTLNLDTEEPKKSRTELMGGTVDPKE